MKVGKGPAGKSEAGQGWEEMQQGGRGESQQNMLHAFVKLSKNAFNQEEKGERLSMLLGGTGLAELTFGSVSSLVRIHTHVHTHAHTTH